MFNVGDYVRCIRIIIDDFGWMGGLTCGKVYRIVEMSFVNGRFFIINDNGKERSYDSRCFSLLELVEVRSLKLEKLKNENR